MDADHKWRICIFIDAANTSFTMKELGWEIDYGRVKELFARRGKLLRGQFFVCTDDSDSSYQSIKPLLDWLRYNGFVVVTKPVKVIPTPDGEVRKGNMKMEIAVEMLKRTVTGMDELVLFSGDGELAPAVEAVQGLGCKVTVVASMRAATCSDELRRQAEEFVELQDVRALIERAKRRPSLTAS